MKFLLYIALILPGLLLGQINFDSIPADKQLIPRNLITNLGTIVIKGSATKSGADYDQLQVVINRDNLHYDSKIENLNYIDDVAQFDFEFTIVAEESNYDIEVNGIKGSNTKLLHSVNSVVAGDVFIIQGQSNAESRMRDGDSSKSFNSEFIRVYANGTDLGNNLSSNDNWYIGQGDGGRRTNGNTGQYGLKIASLINKNQHIPIAIFNGGHGPKNISFFLRDENDKYSLDTNYGRMHYRLQQAGLLSNVRAIIWAQGEEDGIINTSESNYISRFNTLHTSWLQDYPNVEYTFIFQTNNGCGVELNSIMKIKEAQRKIAANSSLIDIIPTSSLTQSNDGCHFKFQGGYDVFGERLYNLISSKLYDKEFLEEYIPPQIIDAYLTDNQTLFLETDSNNLLLNNCHPDNFLLDNSNGATIESIEVSEASIKFSLSKDPGDSPNLSFIGPVNGIDKNFVTNSGGIEIVSFYQFPINTSNYTMWNGVSWTNGLPSASKYVTISGNYQGDTGSIEALDLTISTGTDLNFDTGTFNSVILHGNLTINGSFVLGDNESLVMYDQDATIFGNIIKKERSTNRLSPHDITYWSSPVKNEKIDNVFLNVAKSRIFYYDQDQSSASNYSDDPNYWNIWQLASGEMIPGHGYAAEGPEAGTGVHNISFWGEPNNGDISYLLKGHFEDDEDEGDKDNNFNLVGNPYPSAINITDFFDENKDLIDETVYLWTHATTISEEGDFVSSDYATYNRAGGTASSTEGVIPTDTLGSGQGFFIRAIAPGTLTFKNSMRRADQNTVFFKPEGPIKKMDNTGKNRIWLNLKTELGGFSQILVSFSENGTNEFDKGYDAFKINSSNPISLYSINGMKKYSIQSLPPYPQNQQIKLGVESNVAPRKMSIGIQKAQGIIETIPVILIDHYSNLTHDLKQSDYLFDVVENGSYIDRFSLHFSDVRLFKERVAGTTLFMSLKDKKLKLESNSTIKNIKVYDILGVCVSNLNPNGKTAEIMLNSSKRGKMLFVQVVFINGEIKNKKVIVH